MKVKCDHCSEITDITFDGLIFDDEDEKVFVSYLAAEMSKSKDVTK